MNKLLKTKHFVGEKHFRLTLVERLGINKWNKPIWRMLCECGKETVGVLRDKKSCGCLQKEITRENNIKKRLNSGEANFNRLYKSYQRSAKNKNRDFNLTKEQFKNLINKNCHYCDRPPSSEGMFNEFSFGAFKYNGIDRINSSMGYILENCVSCCSMCNLGKRKLTQQDFFNWVCKVSKHMKKIGFDETETNVNSLLKFGTPTCV